MKKVNYVLHQMARLVAMAVLLSVAGCKKADPDVKPKTVSDIIIENGEFSILREAIQYAGLSDALRSNSITIFAPDDNAFKASGYADAAAVKALPAATVRQILEYHIMASEIKAADLGTGTNLELPTMANAKAYITKTSGATSINGARVVKADIVAANGIIHVIDRIIVPATRSLLDLIRNNREYSFLVAAASLAATTNPTVLKALTSETSAYTLFVPTNQAFMDAGFPSIAALQAVGPTALGYLLLYHLVPGRLFSPNLAAGTLTTAANKALRIEVSNGLRVSGPGNKGQSARVTQADLLARNGVIHVVDRLLLP